MENPATLESLAKHWPELTDDQAELAGTRLDEAWVEVLALYPDIPARITAGTLSEDTVRLVLHRMVKRAMAPRAAGLEGVTSISQGTGPFSQSLSFEGNDGWLGLKASERKLLNAGRRAAQHRAFTVFPVVREERPAGYMSGTVGTRWGGPR